MLTKYKDVRSLDSVKGVNELFQLKMLCVRDVFRIFFRGVEGHRILTFFRQSYFEAHRGTKTALGEHGECYPGIFLKI